MCWYIGLFDLYQFNQNAVSEIAILAIKVDHRKVSKVPSKWPISLALRHILMCLPCPPSRHHLSVLLLYRWCLLPKDLRREGHWGGTRRSGRAKRGGKAVLC